DGGVDVVDLLLPSLAEDVLGQQLGDARVEAGGLAAGGGGEGEHLVGDGAAADQLVLVLDGAGPGVRRDRVLLGHGAGGEAVGHGRALLVGAALAAAEVRAVAGVGGAGGEA